MDQEQGGVPPKGKVDILEAVDAAARQPGFNPIDFAQRLGKDMRRGAFDVELNVEAFRQRRVDDPEYKEGTSGLQDLETISKSIIQAAQDDRFVNGYRPQTQFGSNPNVAPPPVISSSRNPYQNFGADGSVGWAGGNKQELAVHLGDYVDSQGALRKLLASDLKHKKLEVLEMPETDEDGRMMYRPVLRELKENESSFGREMLAADGLLYQAAKPFSRTWLGAFSAGLYNTVGTLGSLAVAPVTQAREGRLRTMYQSWERLGVGPETAQGFEDAIDRGLMMPLPKELQTAHPGFDQRMHEQLDLLESNRSELSKLAQMGDESAKLALDMLDLRDGLQNKGSFQRFLEAAAMIQARTSIPTSYRRDEQGLFGGGEAISSLLGEALGYIGPQAGAARTIGSAVMQTGMKSLVSRSVASGMGSVLTRGGGRVVTGTSMMVPTVQMLPLVYKGAREAGYGHDDATNIMWLSAPMIALTEATLSTPYLMRGMVQKGSRQGIIDGVAKSLLRPEAKQATKQGLAVRAWNGMLRGFGNSGADNAFVGFGKNVVEGFWREGTQEMLEEGGYAIVEEAYDRYSGKDLYEKSRGPQYSLWNRLGSSFAAGGVMGAFTSALIGGRRPVKPYDKGIAAMVANGMGQDLRKAVARMRKDGRITEQEEAVLNQDIALADDVMNGMNVSDPEVVNEILKERDMTTEFAETSMRIKELEAALQQENVAEGDKASMTKELGQAKAKVQSILGGDEIVRRYKDRQSLIQGFEQKQGGLRAADADAIAAEFRQYSTYRKERHEQARLVRSENVEALDAALKKLASSSPGSYADAAEELAKVLLPMRDAGAITEEDKARIAQALKAVDVAMIDEIWKTPVPESMKQRGAEWGELMDDMTQAGFSSREEAMDEWGTEFGIVPDSDAAKKLYNEREAMKGFGKAMAGMRAEITDASIDQELKPESLFADYMSSVSLKGGGYADLRDYVGGLANRTEATAEELKELETVIGLLESREQTRQRFAGPYRQTASKFKASNSASLVPESAPARKQLAADNEEVYTPAASVAGERLTAHADLIAKAKAEQIRLGGLLDARRGRYERMHVADLGIQLKLVELFSGWDPKTASSEEFIAALSEATKLLEADDRLAAEKHVIRLRKIISDAIRASASKPAELLRHILNSFDWQTEMDLSYRESLRVNQQSFDSYFDPSLLADRAIPQFAANAMTTYFTNWVSELARIDPAKAYVEMEKLLGIQSPTVEQERRIIEAAAFLANPDQDLTESLLGAKRKPTKEDMESAVPRLFTLPGRPGVGKTTIAPLIVALASKLVGRPMKITVIAPGAQNLNDLSSAVATMNPGGTVSVVPMGRLASIEQEHDADVFILDEGHLADRATVDAVRELMRSHPNASILVLGDPMQAPSIHDQHEVFPLERTGMRALPLQVSLRQQNIPMMQVLEELHKQVFGNMQADIVIPSLPLMRYDPLTGKGVRFVPSGDPQEVIGLFSEWMKRKGVDPSTKDAILIVADENQRKAVINELSKDLDLLAALDKKAIGSLVKTMDKGEASALGTERDMVFVAFNDLGLGGSYSRFLYTAISRGKHGVVAALKGGRSEPSRDIQDASSERTVSNLFKENRERVKGIAADMAPRVSLSEEVVTSTPSNEVPSPEPKKKSSKASKKKPRKKTSQSEIPFTENDPDRIPSWPAEPVESLPGSGRLAKLYTEQSPGLAGSTLGFRWNPQFPGTNKTIDASNPVYAQRMQLLKAIQESGMAFTVSYRKVSRGDYSATYSEEPQKLPMIEVHLDAGSVTQEAPRVDVEAEQVAPTKTPTGRDAGVGEVGANRLKKEPLPKGGITPSNDKSYRTIGESGFKDLLNYGKLRPSPSNSFKKTWFAAGERGFNKAFSWATRSDNPSGRVYIAEVDNSAFSDQRRSRWSQADFETSDEISIDDVVVYELSESEAFRHFVPKKEVTAATSQSSRMEGLIMLNRIRKGLGLPLLKSHEEAVTDGATMLGYMYLNTKYQDTLMAERMNKLRADFASAEWPEGGFIPAYSGLRMLNFYSGIGAEPLNVERPADAKQFIEDIRKKSFQTEGPYLVSATASDPAYMRDGKPMPAIVLYVSPWAGGPATKVFLTGKTPDDAYYADMLLGLSHKSRQEKEGRLKSAPDPYESRAFQFLMWNRSALVQDGKPNPLLEEFLVVDEHGFARPATDGKTFQEAVSVLREAISVIRGNEDLRGRMFTFPRLAQGATSRNGHQSIDSRDLEMLQPSSATVGMPAFTVDLPMSRTASSHPSAESGMLRVTRRKEKSSPTERALKRLSLNKVDAYYRRVLGDKFVDGKLSFRPNLGISGRQLWGVMENGRIILEASEDGVRAGVERHEAVHYVLDHLLDDASRFDILHESAKLYAEKHGMKWWQVTDEQANEFIAEQYEKPSYDTSTAFGRFMRWLKGVMKRWKLYSSRIDGLLYAIENGDFKNASSLRDANVIRYSEKHPSDSTDGRAGYSIGDSLPQELRDRLNVDEEKSFHSYKERHVIARALGNDHVQASVVIDMIRGRIMQRSEHQAPAADFLSHPLPNLEKAYRQVLADLKHAASSFAPNYVPAKGQEPVAFSDLSDVDIRRLSDEDYQRFVTWRVSDEQMMLTVFQAAFPGIDARRFAFSGTANQGDPVLDVDVERPSVMHNSTQYTNPFASMSGLTKAMIATTRLIVGNGMEGSAYEMQEFEDYGQTRIPLLYEVAQEAAQFIDPGNLDSFAAVLKEIEDADPESERGRHAGTLYRRFLAKDGWYTSANGKPTYSYRYLVENADMLMAMHDNSPALAQRIEMARDIVTDVMRSLMEMVGTNRSMTEQRGNQLHHRRFGWSAVASIRSDMNEKLAAPFIAGSLNVGIDEEYRKQWVVGRDTDPEEGWRIDERGIVSMDDEVLVRLNADGSFTAVSQEVDLWSSFFAAARYPLSFRTIESMLSKSEGASIARIAGAWGMAIHAGIHAVESGERQTGLFSERTLSGPRIMRTGVNMDSLRDLVGEDADESILNKSIPTPSMFIGLNQELARTEAMSSGTVGITSIRSLDGKTIYPVNLRTAYSILLPANHGGKHSSLAMEQLAPSLIARDQALAGNFPLLDSKRTERIKDIDEYIGVMALGDEFASKPYMMDRPLTERVILDRFFSSLLSGTSNENLVVALPPNGDRETIHFATVEQLLGNERLFRIDKANRTLDLNMPALGKWMQEQFRYEVTNAKLSIARWSEFLGKPLKNASEAKAAIAAMTAQQAALALSSTTLMNERDYIRGKDGRLMAGHAMSMDSSTIYTAANAKKVLAPNADPAALVMEVYGPMLKAYADDLALMNASLPKDAVSAFSEVSQKKALAGFALLSHFLGRWTMIPALGPISQYKDSRDWFKRTTLATSPGKAVIPIAGGVGPTFRVAVIEEPIKGKKALDGQDYMMPWFHRQLRASTGGRNGITKDAVNKMGVFQNDFILKSSQLPVNWEVYTQNPFAQALLRRSLMLNPEPFKAMPVDLSSSAISEAQKKHLTKDQFKSSNSNKFIGRGIGATGEYAKLSTAAGKPVNAGSYSSSDVVFVSVNGSRKGRIALDKEEVLKAVAAGASFLADAPARRPEGGNAYNVGEQELADLLRESGYVEQEALSGLVSKWTPASQQKIAGQPLLQAWDSAIGNETTPESFDAAVDAVLQTAAQLGLSEQLIGLISSESNVKAGLRGLNAAAAENPLVSVQLDTRFLRLQTNLEKDVERKENRSAPYWSQLSAIAASGPGQNHADVMELHENEAAMTTAYLKRVDEEIDSMPGDDRVEKVEQWLRYVGLKKTAMEGRLGQIPDMLLNMDSSINNPVLRPKLMEFLSNEVSRRGIYPKMHGAMFADASGYGFLTQDNEAIAGNEAALAEATGRISAARGSEQQALEAYTAEKGSAEGFTPSYTGSEQEAADMKIESDARQATSVTPFRPLRAPSASGGKYQPGEVLMPFLYAQEFGFEDDGWRQMTFHEIRNDIQSRLGDRGVLAFDKAMEVFIVRVPSSGMGSGHWMKVVGFVNGTKNTIYTPFEKNEQTGGDYDGDQLAVYSRNLFRQEIELDRKNDGKPVKKEWTVSEKADPQTVEGLQNRAMDIMRRIYDNPANAEFIMQPVGVEVFQAALEAVESADQIVDPVRLEPFTPTQHSVSRREAFDGAVLIGAGAIMMKAYSLMSGAYHESMLQGNAEDLFRNWFPKADAAGYPVMAAISQSLNAMLDNTKHMMIGRAGITMSNQALFFGMLMDGVSLDEAIKMMRHPLVVEASKSAGGGAFRNMLGTFAFDPMNDPFADARPRLVKLAEVGQLLADLGKVLSIGTKGVPHNDALMDGAFKSIETLINAPLSDFLADRDSNPAHMMLVNRFMRQRDADDLVERHKHLDMGGIVKLMPSAMAILKAVEWTENTNRTAFIERHPAVKAIKSSVLERLAMDSFTAKQQAAWSEELTSFLVSLYMDQNYAGVNPSVILGSMMPKRLVTSADQYHFVMSFPAVWQNMTSRIMALPASDERKRAYLSNSFLQQVRVVSDHALKLEVRDGQALMRDERQAERMRRDAELMDLAFVGDGLMGDYSMSEMVGVYSLLKDRLQFGRNSLTRFLPASWMNRLDFTFDSFHKKLENPETSIYSLSSGESVSAKVLLERLAEAFPIVRADVTKSAGEQSDLMTKRVQFGNKSMLQVFERNPNGKAGDKLSLPFSMLAPRISVHGNDVLRNATVWSDLDYVTYLKVMNGLKLVELVLSSPLGVNAGDSIHLPTGHALPVTQTLDEGRTIWLDARQITLPESHDDEHPGLNKLVFDEESLPIGGKPAFGKNHRELDGLDGTTALKQMAERSQHPIYREMLQFLSDQQGITQRVFRVRVSNLRKIHGRATPYMLELSQSLSPLALEMVFIHEAVHRLTSHALNAPNGELSDDAKRFKATAKALYDEFLSVATDEMVRKYGSDVHEFVAESMSNIEMQQAVREAVDAKGLSIWQKLINAIRRLFGMPALRNDIVARAIDATRLFIERSSKQGETYNDPKWVKHMASHLKMSESSSHGVYGKQREVKDIRDLTPRLMGRKGEARGFEEMDVDREVNRIIENEIDFSRTYQTVGGTTIHLQGKTRDEVRRILREDVVPAMKLYYDRRKDAMPAIFNSKDWKKAWSERWSDPKRRSSMDSESAMAFVARQIDHQEGDIYLMHSWLLDKERVIDGTDKKVKDLGINAVEGFSGYDPVIKVRSTMGRLNVTMVDIVRNPLDMQKEYGVGKKLLSNYVNGFMDRANKGLVMPNSESGMRRFLMGLSAMALKQANPGMALRNAKVLNMSMDSQQSDVLWMHDFLHDLKVMRGTALANELPPRIKAVVDDESLHDASEYDQSWLPVYLEWLQNHPSSDSDFKEIRLSYSNVMTELERINTAENGLYTKSSMLEALRYRMDMINKTRENPDTDPEVPLISQAIAELMQQKTMNRGVTHRMDMLSKLFRNAQDIRHPHLQMLIRTIENSSNNIASEMNAFRKSLHAEAAKLDGLVPSGLRVGGLDLVDNGWKRFERILKYSAESDSDVAPRVYDEDGNLVKVNLNAVHWNEKDPHTAAELAAGRITKAEVAFGAWIAEQAQEMMRDSMLHQLRMNGVEHRDASGAFDELAAKANAASIVNKRYPKGWIPVVRSPFSEKLTQGNLRNALQTLWTSHMNIDNLFNEDVGRYDDSTGIGNRYLSEVEENSSGTPIGNETRLRRMGLRLDGATGKVVAADVGTNLGMTKNIESIMILAKLASVRQRIHEQKSLPVYNATISLFNMIEAVDKRDVTQEKDWARMYADRMLFLGGAALKDDQPMLMNIAPASNLLISYTSFVGVSLSWKVAMQSGILNEIGMLATAIASDIADDGLFGKKELIKAHVMMGDKANRDKMAALLHHHFVTESSEQEAGVNFRKSKTRRLLFSSHTMNVMNWWTDHMARGIVMTAQMLKDGSWDAYSLTDDGEVVYDERKDGQWYENGKLKPDADIIMADLKQALIDDGHVGQEADKPLKAGYDFRSGRRFKWIADKMVIGGMDRTQQPMLNNVWYGRMFSTFSNFLYTKIANWYLPPTSVEAGGKRVVVTDRFTGKKVAKWELYEMTGYVHALNSAILVLANKAGMGWSETKSLTKAEKRAISRLAYDVAMFAVLYGLYAMMVPDEEERKKMRRAVKLSDRTETMFEKRFHTMFLNMAMDSFSASPYHLAERLIGQGTSVVPAATTAINLIKMIGDPGKFIEFVPGKSTIKDVADL